MKKLIIILIAISQAAIAEKDEWSEFEFIRYADSPWTDFKKERVNDVPLSLEQIRNIEKQLSKHSDNKTLFGQLNIMTDSFAINCMSTIGNEQVCHCITEARPYWLTFQDYIKIVTNQKGIKFSKEMTANDIGNLVTYTSAIRDHCITGSPPPPAPK